MAVFGRFYLLFRDLSLSLGNFLIMVSKILSLCVNRVFISVDNGKVCRCHLTDAVSEEEAGKSPSDTSFEDLAVMSEAEKQLREYFDGSRKEFDIPLALEGTPFQRKVWYELLKIPYGLTVTYAEVAKKIGNAKAVRAVSL